MLCFAPLSEAAFKSRYMQHTFVLDLLYGEHLDLNVITIFDLATLDFFISCQTHIKLKQIKKVENIGYFD